MSAGKESLLKFNMHPIPTKLRNEMSDDLFYKKCCRQDENCDGRITWEHALMYAGRQIQKKWAIIPLCVYHHLGPGLNKHLNQYIALERATAADLAEYPKKDWGGREKVA